MNFKILYLFLFFIIFKTLPALSFHLSLFDRQCSFESLKPGSKCFFSFKDNQSILESSFAVSQASCQVKVKSEQCQDVASRFPFLNSRINKCDLDSICGTQFLGSRKIAVKGCKKGLEEAAQLFGKNIPTSIEAAENLITQWGTDFWTILSQAPTQTWEALKNCISEKQSCSPSLLKKYLDSLPAITKEKLVQIKNDFQRFDCLDNEGRFELLCYQSSISATQLASGASVGSLAKKVFSRTLIANEIVPHLPPAQLEKLKATDNSETELKKINSKPVEVIGQAKLESKLGRQVEIIVDNNGNPNFPTIKVIDPKNNKLMGTLDVRYDDRREVLHMNYIETVAAYQNLGVSEALMETTLKEFPDLKIIQTDGLEATNFEVVQKALKQGKDLTQAIMETPAYKIRAKFGFTEIIPNSIDEKKYGFLVKKPTP